MIGIGEYYRTKKGKIHKWSKGRTYIGQDKIVKHSLNIIDLIEVGDYVNGCKVIDICESQYGGEKIIYIGGFGIPKKVYDNQIKSILTHEQYEQNCYKVGDIEWIKKK